MGDSTVREATVEDVDDVLRIAERCWNDAYDGILSQQTIDTAMAEWYEADHTRELIERTEVAYLVAERDGDVVGYLSGGPGESERVANLSAVYVEPNHWGDGAGTALLDAFEAFCSREGYERIQLRVLSENELGVSFYDSRGYDVTAEQTTELFGEPVHELHCSGRVSDAAASPCDSQLP